MYISDFETKCRSYLSDFVPDFKNCFVAGGVFPRLYHDLPVRDIDIYVNDDETIMDLRKQYYAISRFENRVDKEKYIKFEDTVTGIFIDLIGFHNPRDINFPDNFDFTICQFNFSANGGYSNLGIMNDIENKFIRFTGKACYSAGKNNTLTRLKKYLDLGFKTNDEELTKIYQFLTGPDAKKSMMSEAYNGI